MATRINLRNKLAIFIAKLASFSLKLLGSRSTSAPGLLASKISPNLLANYIQCLETDPLYITGTNGKSTTAGMLANILKLHYQKPILHNSSGANLLSGILTCFLNSQVTSTDRTRVLFEADEAVLHKLTAIRKAKGILVNNFFRDQLDRFGEIKTTISLVEKGLKVSEEDGFILVNGDDPNTCYLNSGNVLRYGIKFDESREVYAEELASCPKCESDLFYKKQWLGQFGDFFCSECDFVKPQIDIYAENIKLNTFDSEMQIKDKHITIPLPGLFNVYNGLAAASMAFYLDIPLETIKTGIESYDSLFGRSQKIEYKNKTAYLFLIKNPIGASEVLRLISRDPSAQLLIAINDNYADGRDVSWLWDAEFEYLKNIKNPIFVSGVRATDMGVRLKYTGIKQDKITIESNIKKAVSMFFKQSSTENNLYILPTYTALIQLTKIFKLKY